MSKVIVDDALRRSLGGLDGETEFIHPSGQSLGHFLPAPLYTKLLYAWLKAEITDEDLKQLRQQTGGRSLSEIWQSLGVN